jgi:dihydroorotate dehydrogenase electron transfer subunit
MVQIERIKTEGFRVKSFFFSDESCSQAYPGQFVMVWIPGIDEIPMSLSVINKDSLSAISVKRVGEASQALHNLKIGDIIGVRGPYGRGFEPVTGNIMIVGGGIGMTPLAPLTETLTKLGNRLTVVIGAKTCKELLFLDRIKQIITNAERNVITVTEDCSCGLKGLSTEVAEHVLSEKKFDMVYTCGPERMMHKMFLLAKEHETPLQASLERIMRCAIGLCGSCVIGGLRVCRDGPVFTSEQLMGIEKEFGVFKRDFFGRRVKI